MDVAGGKAVERRETGMVGDGGNTGWGLEGKVKEFNLRLV